MKKNIRKIAAGLLAAAILITQPVQAMAMDARVMEASGLFANLFRSEENSDAFSRLEIRKGTLNGELVVNLLSPSGNWKLEANQDYYVYGEVKKPAAADILQIRAGNADGTFNGLTFFNPPGGSYVPGDITHDYLDRLASYDQIADPTYGVGSGKLVLQDGAMSYHIKDQVGANDLVTFAMGLVVNDTAFGGSSVLTDALEVAVGHMESGSFKADSSKASDIHMAPKGGLRAFYSSTSLTAALDNPSAILTAYIGDSGPNIASSIIYDTLEWDIFYPQDAVLEDIGFNNTSFVKTHTNYGTLTTSEPILENGQQKVHMTLTSGYKVRGSNLVVYLRFIFPGGKFKSGQQCKINYTNVLITPKVGSAPISVTQVTSPAVYTMLDNSTDYTTLGALNRNEVYNHTIDTTDPYMVSLGSALIANKSSSNPSPYEKTYEAQFNTTNTAAVISAVTVPLGTSEAPVVTWYGIDAGGVKKSGILANPADYALNKGNIAGSKNLRLWAADFGIVSFTGVKADIGKLRADYTSSGSSSSWDLLYNASGAFGHFTTGETGIQVKNSFRFYNTDPAYRNAANGDLSVFSQATSTSADRIAFNSDGLSIKNSTGAAVDSVAAGDTVTVSGYTFAYSVPGAIKKGTLLGTDAAAVDPVVYLTLPKGLTYESLSFKTTELEFAKASAGGQVTLPHAVENVSYLNTTGDGTTIFKVTFPKGTTLGYYSGKGSRHLLYYTVVLRTSKSMETKRYEINRLIGITTENQAEAMPYNGNVATLNTVMHDTYGINGGRDYAGITKGAATAQPGFGLQQLAEINVYNAVSVTRINGQAVQGTWQTYDVSDPNSIASMGKNSEGQFQLNIQNTSDSDSGSLQIIIPIPKKGADLGEAFMPGKSEFDMTMTIPKAQLDAAGFTSKYIKISGRYTDCSETVNYTDSDSAGANAILLSCASLPARADENFRFSFKVENGQAGAESIWRNVFQYTTSDHVTSYKNGSYVASSIAGSSVEGIVFEDKNRNGIQDAGEAGVSDVTVVVKDDQNKILSAVTGSGGAYTFQAVRNSSLDMSFTVSEGRKLRFNLPASEQEDGSAVTPSESGLSASKSFSANNAVETVNAALSGFNTLSYSKNHASASGSLPVDGEYVVGSLATVSVKPDNLLLKGYNFKEWNTAVDGTGTGYQPGQTLTITGNTALYAIWELGTYTIRFDYRGATGGSSQAEKRLSHNLPYNTDGNLPAPTRTGYNFGGWCTTSTGTSPVANTTKFVVGEDTTLYALWNPKTGYTVKYNTGGSTVSDGSVSWTGAVVPAATPVRAGYQFDGWDYQGEAVTAATLFGELAGSDASGTVVTLDARWTAKGGYTVSYNTDGANDITDKTAVSWTDDSLLPETMPTKAGSAFGGWTLDGSGVEVKNSDTYGGLAVSENVRKLTLKAVWNSISDNTVHYETGGGTIYVDKTGVTATDKNLIPAVAPVRAGYEFIGWMSGAATVTRDTLYSDISSGATVTLTADWRAKSYTIQYSEGGFADAAKSWSDSGLTGGYTPVKSGSTFSGWYYGAVKVTDSIKLSQLIPQDNLNTIRLTAKWVEESYTIVYDSMGGDAFAPRTEVKYGTAGLLPDKTPVRMGYTFSGWYCGDIPVAASVTCGSLSGQAAGKSITLTARWTGKTGYSVLYNSTGGTAVEARTGLGWNSAGLLPDVNPTRTGYTFKGWVSERTTVGAATTYGSIAATDRAGSSVTLVAQWNEAGGYTVSYNTGAGQLVADKTGVSWNNRNLIPLRDVAPGGFQVTGWTCGGIPVSASTTYGEMAEMTTDNPIVLTAVYEPVAGTDGDGVDVQGKVIEGGEFATYKIDISWGPMKFEYSVANIWDADTHSYRQEMQGWSNEPFNGINNRITTANHSNADVEVDIRAVVEDAEAMEGVTMQVRQQNRADGDKAENMLLGKVPEESADAPEISSYLWLIGTPQNSSILGRDEYSKFGIVNVTIRSAGGTLTPKAVTP